ncbi:MAG: hypothetical protein AB1595_07465 [bacterium]
MIDTGAGFIEKASITLRLSEDSTGEIKTTQNEIKITTALSPTTPPVSGQGTIANISFIARAPGTATLSTSNGYLIREFSKEGLLPSFSTITIATTLPYLEFEDIPNQLTHKPFLITLYAKDSQGNPLFLNSAIDLDDYTHTIIGSITMSGTYTTGTATIFQTTNKGINRIMANVGTISGISNQFIVFADDSYEHKVEIEARSGTITIDMGSSTIGEDWYVEVEDVSSTIELPEGNIGIGIKIEVSTNSGTIEGSLASSFRVDVSYKDEDLGGMDEETLFLES